MYFGKSPKSTLSDNQLVSEAYPAIGNKGHMPPMNQLKEAHAPYISTLHKTIVFFSATDEKKPALMHSGSRQNRSLF